MHRRPVFVAALAATMLAVVCSLAAGAGSDTPTGASGAREITPVTDMVPAPAVTARGWLVYDSAADEPVAGLESGTARPIASITKLMTALVVTDRAQLSDEVVIPPSVNELPADAARMDARAGERWTVEDLLDAMLVQSANDAALALATSVGNGDVDAFVKLMNERADELGLESTHFVSPTGLDGAGDASTSTPLDVVTLLDAALAQPDIADAVDTKDLELTRPSGGAKLRFHNRNPLLGTYSGVDAGKTGFTDAAGYMLVVHDVDEATGGDLIVTTFGSTSERTRVSDMRALLNWARSLRTEVRVLEGGTPLGSIPIADRDGSIDVFACDDVLATVRVGQAIHAEIVVPGQVEAPIREGDEVGEIHIRTGQDPDDGSDPDTAGSAHPPTVAPVCSSDAVRTRSRLDRVRDTAGDWRHALRLGVEQVDDSWHAVRRSL